MKKSGLLALFLVALTGVVQAQDAGPSSDGLLNVFIDCQTRCDRDHFQVEIEFVNHVRNREDADVHLLITRQRTGAGGARYDLEFIGGNRFAGQADTLRYVSEATATDSEVRDGLTHAVSLGLVRFAASTNASSGLQVTYDGGEDGSDEAATEDPWNYWVFRVGSSAFLNGQSSSSSLSLFSNVSATRITDASKLRLGVDASYSESNFDIDDSTSVKSTRRNYGGRALYVVSLSSHWSIGADSRVSSSTFSNYDLAVRLLPAIEYNVFPYDESTRRQFRFMYSVGAAHFNYTEETIFDALTETLPEHRLEIAYEVKQAWGSTDVTLSGSQFLNDLSKNRVTLGGDVDFRVLRGLTVNLGGRVSHIANQLNLPKGDLTDEDILLQQRERATSFSYFASFGLGFTFGSSTSHVVNPRFGR